MPLLELDLDRFVAALQPLIKPLFCSDVLNAIGNAVAERLSSLCLRRSKKGGVPTLFSNPNIIVRRPTTP
ncbi:hypothetical protein OKW50_008169 [Paraburkholderia youngii]|uniref:hypothetical protein n=1 Tax=Paraburkholderia youngii TaxID=2782701 RepID=UPI003D24E1FB